MDDGRYKPMSMQNDGVAGSGKPPPPQILERFRAMVRAREEELIRVSEDEESGVVLSFDEIVRLYEIVLAELTLNSKPIITDLTMIAGEQRMHGAGIADAICARIVEVPVEQKLPTLYLLDSVVKNIGREYVKYFSARLPEVFCDTYSQVHPNMRPAMRHLFGTWRTVFPSSVLRRIESHLQFTPLVNHQSSLSPQLGAAESPRPTHGIHVNPKYLEARRQIGHSTADANLQPPRGTSATSRTYGQKPSIEYDEFNSDDAEVNALQDKSARLSSSVRAVPTSFDTLKLPPSSGVRIRRSSSPYRVGNIRSSSPSLEEFSMDPTTVAERASPSHSRFDYNISRMIGSGEGTVEWKRNLHSGDTKQQANHSAASRYNNEVDLQRPRALIDAYGIDKREELLNHKHPKLERMDVNGSNRIGATKTWQNAEEEEFDWEDMSPTLADHGRHKDVFSSSLPSSGSFRTTSTLGSHNAARMVPDLRHDWSDQAQFSVVNGSSRIEDVRSIKSNDGANSMFSGIRNETTLIQGSQYNQESWKSVQNVDLSSRQHFDATRGGRDLQMSFPGCGILQSAAEQKLPLNGSFPNADAQNRGPPFASRTRSSSFDYSTPEIQLATGPASTGAWPPPRLHSSHDRPLLPTNQPNRPMRGQLDTWVDSNLVMNQDVERSTFSGQFPGSTGSKSQNTMPQLSSQQSGSIPLNQHSLGPTAVLPQQSLLSQDMRQNMRPPVSAPYPFLAQQLNRGYAPPPYLTSLGTNLPNSVPMQSSMPILNVPNASMRLPGVPLPHFPRGPHPGTPQMHPLSQNPTPIAPNASGGGDYSSLFNSLMAQGLISLTDQAPGQDSVGVEFDPDLLKVRHESAITALYADLPRQCTTCGLRFKSQEGHRIHMDWHVTRNRISKNRKQKPSRKWFVSVNMWLTGAEGSRTDAVPGFLPTENVVEEKDDEELAVPADDDQKVCALCGDPFEDFYSDETEEWMYKGAVYINAPTVLTPGMDRTQLGPIVHAKCRPETGGISSEDFRKSADYSEDDSQRKRMRS